MPWAMVDPGSDDERSRTYLCDWPGCTKVAEHVAGCVKELGACAALCAQHASAGGPNHGPVTPGRHSYRAWRNF